MLKLKLYIIYKNNFINKNVDVFKQKKVDLSLPLIHYKNNKLFQTG